MRPGAIGIVDLLLGALGLAVFVYGDLVTNRSLRIVGFVVVTLCVVVAAILATFHNDDS
jgi:peptidoglycan/LPS O-acetylase OafA/YrhL